MPQEVEKLYAWLFIKYVDSPCLEHYKGLSVSTVTVRIPPLHIPKACRVWGLAKPTHWALLPASWFSWHRPEALAVSGLQNLSIF